MADHDDLIQQFCGAIGAPPDQARHFLEAHNWDLAAACDAYYQDELDGAETSASPQQDTYTGPRTLDGRPAPEAQASSSSRPAAQPKKKGIATLGTLGGSSHHHDDDDDDEDDDDEDGPDGRGNLFAGGEKSGLAVQDPQQGGGGPKQIINELLAKAKANSRRSGDSEEGPSQTRFRGTGMTLGGDGVESRSIPDAAGPSRAAASGPVQERVLHIWQDGFSIDDGELRRFDDPANQQDLQIIRMGRAPLHLMNVQEGQPVDVKLHQHETPYVAQPKKYKPFSGSGQRLGSEVPGASSSSAAPSAPSAPATSSSSSGAPAVDSSQPTLTLRIQLPDGTRLPARFNTTHTLGDVYDFVQSSSPDTRTRSWVLATTFPNKEHTDKDLVLGEMAEFKKGGTAVVKWA